MSALQIFLFSMATSIVTTSVAIALIVGYASRSEREGHRLREEKLNSPSGQIWQQLGKQ